MQAGLGALLDGTPNMRLLMVLPTQVRGLRRAAVRTHACACLCMHACVCACMRSRVGGVADPLHDCGPEQQAVYGLFRVCVCMWGGACSCADLSRHVSQAAPWAHPMSKVPAEVGAHTCLTVLPPATLAARRQVTCPWAGLEIEIEVLLVA